MKNYLAILSLLTALSLSAKSAEYQCVFHEEGDSRNDNHILIAETAAKNEKGEPLHVIEVTNVASGRTSKNKITDCVVDTEKKYKKAMDQMDNAEVVKANELLLEGKMSVTDHATCVLQVLKSQSERNALLENTEVLICSQAYGMNMIYAFTDGPSLIHFCMGGAGCSELMKMDCEEL